MSQSNQHYPPPPPPRPLVGRPAGPPPGPPEYPSHPQTQSSNSYTPLSEVVGRASLLSPQRPALPPRPPSNTAPTNAHPSSHAYAQPCGSPNPVRQAAPSEAVGDVNHVGHADIHAPALPPRLSPRPPQDINQIVYSSPPTPNPASQGSSQQTAKVDDVAQSFGELRIAASHPSAKAPVFHEVPSHTAATAGSPLQSPPGNTPSPSPHVDNSPPAIGKEACLDTLMTFPTTWYSHPEAPEVWMCSRCHDRQLRGTRLEGEFNGRFFDDEQPRCCSFSTPRMKNHLLKQALERGSLRNLVDFIKHRATVPDCKGAEGAKGSQGVSWLIAKDNAIPGLVVCQACWEDFLLATPFSVYFEPASYPQGVDDVWVCDMSTLYVRKQYAQLCDWKDWQGFAGRASERIQTPACPKAAKAPLTSRKWHSANCEPGIMLCAACYCDYIIGSGDEGKFREVNPTEAAALYGDEVTCATGALSINIGMSCAEDRKDQSLFWGAVQGVLQNPECVAGGMKGATWYTLRSDPKDFAVCGACYAGFVKAMNLEQFFIPKMVPPDIKYMCCCNPAFARFGTYVAKFLEAYYNEDTAGLEAFAAVYAQIPICRRENRYKGGLWYGWPNCTICAECHLHFVRGTALASSMPYQPARLEESTMCEMYSPRMRNLYLQACATNPPDPTELLAYSEQRRLVNVQTLMVVRQLETQQRLAMGEARRLQANSMFYTAIGNSQAAVMGSSHTYGMAGVGYGFQNQLQLDGAMYGKQASAASSQITHGSTHLRISELQRQWQEFE